MHRIMLVAIEPQMYRQAFVHVLRNHRQDIEIEPCLPEELEQEIEFFHPILLLCHDTAPEVRRRVKNRVEISLLSHGIDANIFMNHHVARVANISVERLFEWLDKIAPLNKEE